MPTYTYVDQATGFQKDVFHSMSECSAPSDATIEEITHEGRRMTRAVTAPAIAEFGSLSALSKKDRLKPKTPEQKQKMIERSRQHAKREGIQDMKRQVEKDLVQQGREIFGR
jgi:hypothetical protein